ncbi:type II secretion system F family protein [Schaalia odontolytica]
MSPWMFWVLDVLVGTLAAGGVAFLLAAWFASRPSFVARVAQGRVSQEAPSPLTVWARRASAAALESLGSTTESVARRLALAGMAPEVSVFRLHQALAGIAGLVLACTIVAARPSSSLRASIIPLCACALIGSLLGVAGMDRFLTLRAHARQRAIDAAVPDCAELLALAVAAGESIPAAIERVAGCAGGSLGIELALTAGHIRNGTPSVRALADLDERTESPALTRLSRTLTTAIERGSPLASVLHDQARDQRERSLAALMEEGGRREIAMLLPVVFLILPVTVMFALYPGLIALDFTP